VGERVENAKEDISTEKKKKSENAWVSETDEKSGRAECFKEAKVEGSKETYSVMLPKENRLIDDYDFRRVKRLGKSYHCPLFKLTVAPQKISAAPRFGFVISTKIDKRATVRNRINRLLRQAIRERLGKISEGLDLVFVVRPKIIGKNYEEVSTEVDQVLSKISFA